MIMELSITTTPSMTSIEIAELVGKRHDNVKRTIETLIFRGVITSPQIEEKPTAGRPTTYYLFEGEQGKRDGIIVVAQLCPEFTARLVDRWRELEEERRRPKSQAELIAEMALLNLEQERRLNQVEAQLNQVTEKVEQIKHGTIPEGWVGFPYLCAKTGLTKPKCKRLAEVFSVPVDSAIVTTADGIQRPEKIVQEDVFLRAFIEMMDHAEPRKLRWYHPDMGYFQVLGFWGGEQ
ncbi:Rha family transcriptional regulator [Salmonella enterica]|uniref:Rha family transcriptional regulator n=1 Tax=Salmonella enterica TaxID=28901 RepID=UPI0020C90F39|nr:Rha family transcriptional regulator [Salmonella enterica]EDL9740006.1 DNA-binding protein [Salmonella enterica subsp. enterica serovar Newport]MCT7041338.1 Rha family transcriptional regulator [Salmonella enterica subsp. enterica serovar Pomona]MCT7065422.1 Rha family transcriptional regulator [Salmonella enterica subsp. enterica serovar Soahanina]